MRDTVYVHGLVVEAHIGVTAEERAVPQPLLLDLEVACDTSAAATSDAIDQAVDYHALAQAVEAHVAQSRVQLLETLAESVAALIRAQFDVPWVFVKVGKPRILDSADEVGVAIERGNRDAE